MDTYNRYTDFVRVCLETNDLTNFKNNDNYTYMLEHVSQEQGIKYLECITKNTTLTTEEILLFCRLNDSISNPVKFYYSALKEYVSPSSLRYIYHSHLILSHIQNTKNTDIVEVGCGYGGLCLAILFFSKKYSVTLSSYTLVDLTDASNLQKLYIGKVNFLSSVRLNFVDASTFGNTITNINLFLVSNYCFSEIHPFYQQQYIKILFPKVSHGFMAWNSIDTYDFGFRLKIENEEPLTGNEKNKYVYF